MSISLNPQDHVEGTSLLDDVDVLFTEPEFTMFDYGGKRAEPAPALKIVMLPLDEEGNAGEAVDQYFSVGNASDWMPSDDGREIIAIGKATALNTNSNISLFLQSMLNSGFPAEKMGSDCSFLDGIKAHVNRVPAPERPGLKKDASSSDRARTVLIVTAILEIPGEKAAGKKAPAKAAGKAPAKPAAAAKKPAAATEGEGVDDKAVETMLSILADEPSGIAKSKIPGKVFKLLKDDPDRNDVLKLLSSDEFLNSREEFALEGGIVSFPE